MKHALELHCRCAHTKAIAVLSYPADREIDPTPVSILLTDKGVFEAEELICKVLEDIALRLDVLQVVVADHQFEEIAKQARRIEQIAIGLGLQDVQKIAAHAAGAAAMQDGVAVHAIMARLERAFDTAVTEIWALRPSQM